MAIKILCEEKTPQGLTLKDLILSLRGCYQLEKSTEGKFCAHATACLYADRDCQPLKYEEVRVDGLSADEATGTLSKPLDALYAVLKAKYPAEEKEVDVEEQIPNEDGSFHVVVRKERHLVPKCEDC
jgi:hypothetical protein